MSVQSVLFVVHLNGGSNLEAKMFPTPKVKEL